MAASDRHGRGDTVRWVRRVALLALLAVAAYLIVVPILAFSNVNRVDADPRGQRPAEQPGTTYLLVGSDSRAGLTATERHSLHTGGGTGSRADSLMLLHTGDGPNVLVSIPRASIVDVPGHGNSMINGAYEYGGPELLVKTIEDATGIRIDHFVQIGFGGVVGLVDAVGGVTICPAVAMDDAPAGLHVRAGCQRADGRRALAYARSREAQAHDDLDRAAHQRELIAAVGAQVLAWRTFLEPARYWSVMRGGAAAVTVGDGMGPLTFAKLASALRHVDAPDGMTCEVPITDASVQSAHWDAGRAERMFALIRQDRTDEIGTDLCGP